MVVAGSRLIHSASLVLRSLIASGTTDPLGSDRAATSPFVMTAYPQRNVQYPVVVINTRRVNSERLGVSTSGTIDTIHADVDVFSRTVRERDVVADNIFDALRTSQFDVNASRGTGTLPYGLWDFNLVSETAFDEEGPEGLHRKVLGFQYKFVTT